MIEYPPGHKLFCHFVALTPWERRQEPIIISPDFEKRKKKLRELYKLWKAGLISTRDINAREKRLLRRYYGVK